jgi:hypothetical protein
MFFLKYFEKIIFLHPEKNKCIIHHLPKRNNKRKQYPNQNGLNRFGYFFAVD